MKRKGVDYGIITTCSAMAGRGFKEGMQSGMRAERRATIENLLRVRFGSLDDQQRLLSSQS